MSLGDGIRCPLCDGEMHVMETRQNRGSLRRRRACDDSGCRGRLTTVEMPAPTFSKAKAQTFELVAIPSVESVDLEVVPRRLMAALRDLLATHDVSSPAAEEHW